MVKNFTEIPDPSREFLHLYFLGCRSVSENCKNFHPSKIPHYTISYQYSRSVTHPLCCRSVTTNLPLSSSQHFITPSNKSKKNQELHIWRVELFVAQGLSFTTKFHQWEFLLTLGKFDSSQMMNDHIINHQYLVGASCQK